MSWWDEQVSKESQTISREAFLAAIDRAREEYEWGRWTDPKIVVHPKDFDWVVSLLERRIPKRPED